jgi:hypothetical protein
MSPGEAETSEGVKASDLLRVGEPTTMVIILEKGDKAEGAVEEAVDAAMDAEASVLLADFEGRSFPFPASIPSAVSWDPGDYLARLFLGCKKNARLRLVSQT